MRAFINAFWSKRRCCCASATICWTDPANFPMASATLLLDSTIPSISALFSALFFSSLSLASSISRSVTTPCLSMASLKTLAIDLLAFFFGTQVGFSFPSSESESDWCRLLVTSRILGTVSVMTKNQQVYVQHTFFVPGTRAQKHHQQRHPLTFLLVPFPS